MNKIVVTLCLLLATIAGQVNAQGIEFEHIGLDEAMAKAEKENKLIFIDFYTEWCGPCKMMSANVFPDPKIGSLYNSEFVCIKLDAEKEGREAAKKYGVTAYPTLAYLNSKGELVFKKVGAKDIAQVIQYGYSAVESVRNGSSLVDFKAQYESRKTDERFLRNYIEKLIDNRENPNEVIEQWLSVQKSVKENDVDMMEFLMKHSSYLMVGGKAEQILKTNYNEYWDIATRAEEKQLKKMQATLVYNTMKAAYDKKDPVLMRTFLTTWKELPEDQRYADKESEYELDYLLFAKEYDQYKKMAAAYLDSIQASKSLEQIRKEDQATYEDYKTTKYAPSLMGNATLEALSKGKIASEQIKAFNKTIRKYSHYCASKKADYERMSKWIDYASKLNPEDYTMDNLRADILNKQGKTKEAIQYKELALTKLPAKARERSGMEKELASMKSGESR